MPVDAVRVHILYWGVCHTDVRNPLADDCPDRSDREIVGRVAKVGAHVIVYTQAPERATAALRASAAEIAQLADGPPLRQRIERFHDWLDEATPTDAGDIGALFLQSDGSLVQGRRNRYGGVDHIGDPPSPLAKSNLPIRIVNASRRNANERSAPKYRFVVDAQCMR
ncbi:hypothetical protein HC024_11125 [Methylococcaceae bacterium WWC4]|nr:hypothetical protein [Methylococcaceae bacterium WWC4]